MTETCRLYLITPPVIEDIAAFSERLDEALAAGDVACVQLRLKASSGALVRDDLVISAAERLAPITKRHDAALVINDRPDLAKAVGADGVHVGQSDGSCREARAIVGDDAIVGVTCHNSKHLALTAGEDGADYAAFGAFFATGTKDAPTRAEPEILEWWRYATTIPSVAIGGITAENCRPLVHAGADFLAVSGAVWTHPEGPGAAVREFNAVIAETLSSPADAREL